MGPGLAIFQSLAYLYAARCADFGTTGGKLYLGATVCGAPIIFPYTVLVILPMNEKLLRRAAAAEGMLATKKNLYEDMNVDMEDGYRMVDRWVHMSKVRAAMPLGSIACALCALLV